MEIVRFLSGEISTLLDEINQDLKELQDKPLRPLPYQDDINRVIDYSPEMEELKPTEDLVPYFDPENRDLEAQLEGSSQPEKVTEKIIVPEPKISEYNTVISDGVNIKQDVHKKPKVDSHRTSTTGRPPMRTEKSHPYTEPDRHKKSKFTLRVDSQLLQDFKDVCKDLDVHCNEVLTVHMRDDVHKHKQRRDLTKLKIKLGGRP